jgi:protein-S-isoprenylcysteine O-methyltransferase Ste14
LSTSRRGQDGDVTNAPAYRVWPPIALGVPLLIGVTLTAAAGDPFTLPPGGARIVGAVLVVVFGIWNEWTLAVMAANRAAVLPGGETRVVLDRGPFRLSRNPLYLGLIVLDVALTLLWPSVWALIGVPVGMALLRQIVERDLRWQNCWWTSSPRSTATPQRWVGPVTGVSRDPSTWRSSTNRRNAMTPS